MKYDFYNGYNIDDSNIGCDKVIVSQCPESGSDMPNHVYKSICELIADCPAIRQLEKDCVVDFFNEDWSRQYNPKVPKYLKLNSNGCLEWAAVDCPCEDEKVKAMACDDEPGYLIEKITGGVSSNGKYRIDVEKDSCSRISIIPDGPTNEYILEENFPKTGSGDIKYKNGKIVYIPDLDPEVGSNASYAVWYHQGGRGSIPTEDWSTMWFKNSNTSVMDGYSFSNDSDPICQGTKDIIKGKGKHLFGLTRSGVYVLAFNCCIRIKGYQGADDGSERVEAIRAGLILDSGSSKYVGRTVGDFKYHGVNEQTKHFPLKYVSFNSAYVLHIKDVSMNSPVWICARVRTDTRTFEGTPPPDIMLEATNDGAFEPHSLLPVGSPNQGTNTTVTCCRVADYPTITDRLIEED